MVMEQRFSAVKAYLYILQSAKSGHYYIGSTIHPDERLSRHNANAVRATRNKGPWQRVALVEFKTLESARKAEMFIKRQKSRRIIELIMAGDFVWPERLL